MSYRITINGEPFCSSHAEETAILNPKLKLQANTAGTLTFTILPDHPYYDKINDRQSMFDVYLNDELIFEGTPVSQSTDFYNRKTVECEGELTWLNDTIQRQAVYSNQTVETLLAAYLTVHNSQADLDKQFSLGTVTVNGGSGIYRFTNYSNTMTEIGEDLIDNFGGYLRVRHSGGTRYLDYLASSPRASSQVIRIGKNLVDLTKNLSSLDICTVLIPLGAKEENSVVPGLDARLTIKSVNNDKDYIVGTAAAYFGNIWRTNVWDDVTTAAALKSKAEDYLTDAQWENLVISASAIDLGLTDDDVQQFRVLDMIRVVSEPHGIDRYFMLTKLDIDLNHPGQTQITLGEQKTVGLSAKTSQVAQEVEHQESTILVNASEHARQILETATGGCVYFHYDQYGVCDEIRIMNTNDPDTATKIWRWNINGWGYSDDGGQSYTVAATMDGVIYANMIKAGILSSDDGRFYVNLDTGAIKLQDAEITGGTFKVQATGSNPSVIDFRAQYQSSGVTQNAQMQIMSSGILGYSTSGTDPTKVFNLLPDNLLFMISGKTRVALLNDSNGGVVRVYDSDGKYRAVLNQSGLRFYDASGNLTNSYLA